MLLSLYDLHFHIFYGGAILKGGIPPIPGGGIILGCIPGGIPIPGGGYLNIGGGPPGPPIIGGPILEGMPGGGPLIIGGPPGPIYLFAYCIIYCSKIYIRNIKKGLTLSLLLEFNKELRVVLNLVEVMLFTS